MTRRSPVPTYLSSLVAARWPVILVFTLPWVLVAALLGYFVGRVAAGIRNVWMSACVGAACSLPTAAIYSILFISRAQARQTHAPLRIVLVAGSIGAVTGVVAWRAAYRRRHPEGLGVLQFSLGEMVLLVAAIAVYLAAFII